METRDIHLGFWKDLKTPFFCQAPMADVTDAAFRKLIATYGKPDVMWTEFVSVDGLSSAGREVLIRDLEFAPEERPIVAQIFGSNPENFTRIAKLCAELGFDGIDINMGCPAKVINKQGAGARLIKDPKLAQEIVRATKRGAPDLPVSVKTRIGYTKDQTEEWIGALLQVKPAVISIHARTQKEMSKASPHWDAVARAVKLRDQVSPETLIVANGGILTHEEGRWVVKETGCDGIMMGKALFGNPWLFSERKDEPSVREKLEVMLEHTKLFVDMLGDIKNFAIMKKHYKAYVNGFDGAKELRMELMVCDTYEQIEEKVLAFLNGVQ